MNIVELVFKGGYTVAFPTKSDVEYDRDSDELIIIVNEGKFVGQSREIRINKSELWIRTTRTASSEEVAKIAGLDIVTGGNKPAVSLK